VEPVTIIVGEEEFLVDRAVKDLIAVSQDAGLAGDVHDLDAAALGPGELDSLTSPSLFGGGCVLVIRSAQDAAKDVAAELARYAASPAPDVSLILTHAGGAKGKELLASVRAAGARVIECPKVTRFAERLDFVRAEFRRAGKRADDAAARALLDAVGSDLRELAAACDQLAADATDHVDEAMVATYFRGRAEATGFTVADRAVEGHLAQSLEQLRWALATGVSPVLICSALAQGVRLLGRVGSAPRGLNAAALAAEVGAPPWKIDRVRQQLRGWEPEGIARALHAVAEADAQVKGETTSAGYALERAIRRIVAARAARALPCLRAVYHAPLLSQRRLLWIAATPLREVAIHGDVILLWSIRTRRTSGGGRRLLRGDRLLRAATSLLRGARLLPGDWLLRGQRGLLRLDDGLAAQPRVVGRLAAADAEQPPGPHQVDDEQQVDRERRDPQPGDLPGQLVDLVRQEDRGRHHGEVLAPPLAQPQPDAFHQLDQGVGSQPDGQVGERAGGERERLMDQPEQPGVVHVEAEVPVQGADVRQIVVVRALEAGLVVPEAPHPVGCDAEDQEAQEPLHREYAQDQLAAYFLTPEDQRCRRRRAAGVLSVGYERAAAQASPGRPARRGSHQPLPQLRLVRRVRHVALAGTAEQAPVHVLRIARPPAPRANHASDRPAASHLLPSDLSAIRPAMTTQIALIFDPLRQRRRGPEGNRN
jgi:DNA polymerase-3 subunit delta